LERAVHEQRMREDLYFRLMDVEIHMPPIRDRPEDIPLLAEHFNYHYCRRLRREYVPLPQDSLREMRRDPWPGNVRELGARVKSYVTTGEPEVLRGVGGDVAVGAAPPERSASADPGPHNGETAARSGDGGKARPAPPGPSPSRPIEPLKSAVRRVVEETERSLIEEALQRTLWNRRKAAKLLEISYSSLLRRIDAYEIGKE
jgi:two-component system response regulator AtoC